MALAEPDSIDGGGRGAESPTVRWSTAAPPRRRLARDGAISLVASGVMQLLNVVSGIVIARSLGPAGRGELAAVLLWPALLAYLSGLGCADAITYLASRLPDRARDIGATGLVLAVLQGAAVVGAGYVVLPALLGHYGGQAVQAGRLYLAWAPLMLLTTAGAAVLRGRMSLLAANATRVAVIVLTVAGLAGLVAAGRLTVPSVVAVYLGANVATLVVTLWILASRRELGVGLHRDLVRPILAYGLRAHVGNVSTLASTQAGQALVALLLAPIALGLYSVAATVTSSVNLVGASLALVAMPAVGGCASAAEMRTAFARFVRSTLALSALAALATALATPLVMSHLFGRAFGPAVGPACVLLVGGTFASTNLVLSAGLNAFNRPMASSVAQVLATAVTALALGGLLPAYGIVGAALASALAAATATAYMVAHATRHLDLAASDLLPRPGDLAWAWRTLLPRLAFRGAR
jgi:O-antigen/teichoic acid export membrane protein